MTGLASAVLSLLLGGVLGATPAAAAAPVGSATAETVAATAASGLRVAVATVDTRTGVTTAAGEADALFPAESVVKVLVAARLLVEGRLTGELATAATAMVTASDDEAANVLWGEVGGPDVVTWAVERYGLTGLGAPCEWGWWGNTKVSASGLAALYAALAADPLVAPWLLPAMAATTGVAADGSDQTFGLGRWLAAGRTAVKQGWGGDDDTQSTANLLSTGYLDDRYAVVVIVQDPDTTDALALVPDLDAVTAALVDDLTGTATDTADGAVDEPTAGASAAGDRVPVAGDLTAAVTPVDAGPWWPSALAVLGATAIAAATAASLSVATRRATARPS